MTPPFARVRPSEQIGRKAESESFLFFALDPHQPKVKRVRIQFTELGFLHFAVKNPVFATWL